MCRDYSSKLIIDRYLKRLSRINKSLFIKTKETQTIFYDPPIEFKISPFKKKEVFGKTSISRSYYLFLYKFEVMIPLITNILKPYTNQVSKKDKRSFLKFHYRLMSTFHHSGRQTTTSSWLYSSIRAEVYRYNGTSEELFKTCYDRFKKY